MRHVSELALSRRAWWLVVAAVSAALVGWELVLYRAVIGGGLEGPALARALLLDLVWGGPLAALALAVALRLARRLRMEGAAGLAALASLVLGLLLVPASLAREQALALFPGTVPEAAGSVDALAPPLREGAWLCSSVGAPVAPARGPLELLASGVRAALLLQAAALPAFVIALTLAWRQRPRGALRLGLITLAGGLVTVVLLRSPGEPGPGAPPPLTAAGCPEGRPVRRYDVSAIDVRITLNRFGDQVPAAHMFVPDRNIPAVRAQEREALPDRVSLGLRGDAIQPLVLRANRGECLVVGFTNRLSRGEAGLHIEGIPWTVVGAAGAVAPGPDGLAGPGQTLTYVFRLPSDKSAERAYFLHDPGERRQRVARGLFGALVVEPEGASYQDASTGEGSDGVGWEALIHAPGAPAFREFVLFHHDVGDGGPSVLDAEGRPLLAFDPASLERRGITRALNYRAESIHHRFLAGGVNEAQAFGSYTYGDPATPMPRAYLGDPVKLRLVHGGGDSFHVHRLHGGATRWRGSPKVGPPLVIFGMERRRTAEQVAESHPLLRTDAQTLWAGVTLDAEVECGAGGCQQGAGDFLFRCTLEGHAEAGEWGLWRVFDTLQPGLAVLPDRKPPPRAVPSTGLLGRAIGGKRVVLARDLRDPRLEQPLEALIEGQLPPRGERFHELDATVWDWARVETPEGPLYLGEPEAAEAWPNYRSPTPGERPPILFNPENGRYAWPLLRPHLGKRAPFSPDGHGGAPWLGADATADRPDGVCPSLDAVAGRHRKRRVFSVVTSASDVLAERLADPTTVRYAAFAQRRQTAPAVDGDKPLLLIARALDCVDLLLVNGLPAAHPLATRRHPRPDLHTHFLRFDPQASAGVVSGFSFAQEAEPYRASGRILTRPSAAGDTEVQVNHVTGLRPGIWLGVGLGEGMCGGMEASPEPDGAPPATASPCTEVRRIARIQGTTLVLTEPLRHPHGAGEFVDVEFVRFRWYADGQYGMGLAPEAPLLPTGRPGDGRPLQSSAP